MEEYCGSDILLEFFKFPKYSCHQILVFLHTMLAEWFKSCQLEKTCYHFPASWLHFFSLLSLAVLIICLTVVGHLNFNTQLEIHFFEV